MQRRRRSTPHTFEDRIAAQKARLGSAALPPMRSLIWAATTSRFRPATRATPGSGGGHGKNRGADVGDRHVDRGRGYLRDEPFARAGSVRYELRISGGRATCKKAR